FVGHSAAFGMITVLDFPASSLHQTILDPSRLSSALLSGFRKIGDDSYRRRSLAGVDYGC
ncbi:MAG TPA: hypothetical protein VGF67_10455, partial [Ktedonobacteraceae bacterium]